MLVKLITLLRLQTSVIRFWEHEVNGSPQLVVDKIKHYVEGLKMAEVEGEPIKTLFDVL